MSEPIKAWVWASYQGVIHERIEENSLPVKDDGRAEDRAVQFKTIQNSRSKAMGSNVTDARYKFGVTIAASILIGAFFPLIALGLFLVAALLIASGKEPKKNPGFSRRSPWR